MMHRSIWAAVILAGGMLCFERTGGLDRMFALASTAAEDTLSASFTVCGEGRRMNCVVDGDTFWFKGEKIRIADIDAPEIFSAHCRDERSIGEASRDRLLELLNGGSFTLVAGWRDTDRFGRKLRTVTRHGKSLGAMLVQEGLARRWNGPRRDWCARDGS